VTGANRSHQATCVATGGPIRDAGPPRLALRLGEAAASVGVSHDYFADEIAPELRIVRKGRVRLVPVTEIQSWLDRNAAYAVADR
jgi:hypothetical protein